MKVQRSKTVQHIATITFSDVDLIFLIKQRLKAGGLLIEPGNAQVNIEFECRQHFFEQAIATITTTEYVTEPAVDGTTD